MDSISTLVVMYQGGCSTRNNARTPTHLVVDEGLTYLRTALKEAFPHAALKIDLYKEFVIPMSFIL